MNRRRFILNGLQVIACGSWLSFAPRLNIFANSWQNLVNNLTADGDIKVILTEGVVQSNGLNVTKDQVLHGNNLFQIEAAAKIVLKLPNGAVLYTYDNSKLAILCTKNNGSVINLVRGQLLILGNQQATEFYPLLIHTNNADYGLRQGAFFSKILHNDDAQSEDSQDTSPTDATDAQKQPSPLNSLSSLSSVQPNYDYLEYNCLCNGLCDLPAKDYSRNLQAISAHQHNSFYLLDKGKFSKAPLLYHDDDMIRYVGSLIKDYDYNFQWLY